MVYVDRANTQQSPNPLSFLQQWRPLNLKREAVTFPAEMYTSPEIYQLEKQCIFGKA